MVASVCVSLSICTPSLASTAWWSPSLQRRPGMARPVCSSTMMTFGSPASRLPSGRADHVMDVLLVEAVGAEELRDVVNPLRLQCPCSVQLFRALAFLRARASVGRFRRAVTRSGRTKASGSSGSRNWRPFSVRSASCPFSSIEKKSVLLELEKSPSSAGRRKNESSVFLHGAALLRILHARMTCLWRGCPSFTLQKSRPASPVSPALVKLPRFLAISLQLGTSAFSRGVRPRASRCRTGASRA